MSFEQQKKLFFISLLSTILLFTFLLFLCFSLSRSFYGNNREVDDIPNISNEETSSLYGIGKNVYECSSLCFCEDDDFLERRRNGLTGTGKSVISLFFVSISSVFALKMSKDHLIEMCKEELSTSACSPHSIQAEVLNCQDIGENRCGCLNKHFSVVHGDEEEEFLKRDYLDEIQEYNLRKSYPKPKKSALIVIDMQNFFSSIKNEIVDNVLEIIGSCYDSGMKIIFTRYGFKKDGSGGKVLVSYIILNNHISYIPKYQRVWCEDLAEYGSQSWELFDEMKEIIDSKLENDCHIVDKEGLNSFHDTDLDDYLSKNGIEEVVIIGVKTNACCASTARAAFDYGYKNYVISDATAGSSEEQHIEQLKILSFATSYVLSTSQLLEYLKNGEL